MNSDWEWFYQPSNGTEGDRFMYGPAGCHSCDADHGFHIDDEAAEPCLIMLGAYVGEAQQQWERNTKTGETRCTAWRGPCDCTTGTTYKPPPDDWTLNGNRTDNRRIR